MTLLKEFQLAHGREWEEIANSTPFAAALALAQSEKIKEIVNLTDDEIATKGSVILADLRGFLQYESGLLGLHEKKEFVFQELGPETYPDPITEAREEAISDAQEEQQQPASSGAFVPPAQKKLPSKRKSSKKTKS